MGLVNRGRRWGWGSDDWMVICYLQWPLESSYDVVTGIWKGRRVLWVLAGACVHAHMRAYMT